MYYLDVNTKNINSVTVKKDELGVNHMLFLYFQSIRIYFHLYISISIHT